VCCECVGFEEDGSCCFVFECFWAYFDCEFGVGQRFLEAFFSECFEEQ